MDTPSTFIRELAQRLLAASRSDSSEKGKQGGPPVHEALLVCETLRISLSRFAGADGFSALMRRALALAKQEVPALSRVRIGSAQGARNQWTCNLEGFDEVAAGPHATEAAIALAANLLHLLVTFIGEPLTLKLVREAWPGADVNL